MEANSLIIVTDIQIQKLESKTEMNDLPDHILDHIISFLPTKFAVQTSVLSKRWKSLWKRFATVELKEKVYDDMERSEPEREQFFSFVEKVRKLCNSSCLRKFSLACYVLDDDAYIQDIIKHFINHKVIEELNLELRRPFNGIHFPDSLFQTCGSLKKLQISLCHFLPITPHVYFQSLKILVLKDVAFPKNETQDLFSGCPCLEELSIIDCSWNDIRAVCISSPMLRKLFIRDSNLGYGIGELIPEEEYPDKWGPIPRCRVMIFATKNFKSFSYKGHLINDFFLNGCTSVTEASIEIQCRKWDKDWEGWASCYVFNLLKELPNVKKLSLSSTAILVLGFTIHEQIPYFYKLAELRVVSPLPQELSSPALLTIFLNSFCLESIHFDRGVTLSQDDADEEFCCLSNILHTCFLTHVKAIHICSFKGDEGELSAVRVLLEAASVLDTFHIEFDKTMRPKELLNLKFEILDFPVRSRRCTIEFG